MNSFWLLLFLSSANYVQISAQYQLINIGAIFYDDEYEIEITFNKTINYINRLNEVSFKLIPVVERLHETDDRLTLEKKACALLEKSVAAIFGPSSKAESDIVSLICNSTGIPHLLFDTLIEETELQSVNHKLTLNVFPSQLILSKAYADIVNNYNWKKFSIVYDADDETAIFRLQDLLQLRNIHHDLVRVRKFRKGEDYRILWKGLTRERRVVLDCPGEMLVELINASMPFGLTDEYNSLFLTNLDDITGILDELRNNETFTVNITSVQLAEKRNINFEEEESNASFSTIDDDTPKGQLLPDLLHDAVMLFYLGLKYLYYNGHTIYTMEASCVNLDYSGNNAWNMGTAINKAMRYVAPQDDTYFHYSYMQFDDFGQRTNFSVEIYEPMDNLALGYWDTKGNIRQRSGGSKLGPTMFKVATRIGAPYFMEKPDAVANNITGNDRYEGYAVDLIDKLSKKMQFEYKFIPVRDNSYGKYNEKTKQWDGIMGEIINNGADMGICDLTITQDRQQAVDFTVPFMQLGVGILAYKKTAKEHLWYSFLSCFTSEVWVFIMISLILIALLLFFVARISQGEWGSPHPCNKKSAVVENVWDFPNSSWLAIGSIMTVGCDILPRSAPTRLFAAFWWIFVLIIANSYTASNAAALTSSKMEGSITDFNDLVKQAEVTYGTIYGGSTFTYIKESNETNYRLAYNRMHGLDPKPYTKSNEEGRERVLKNNGSYMFLMETTSLEYFTERDCRLRLVGDKFQEKHYAIALPFGSKYKSNLSVAILRLAEKGELYSLKQKWWKTNNSCYDPDDISGSGGLTYHSVRGVFYTLFAGLGVGYIIGILDFLIHVQHLAAEEGQTFRKVFLREIKYILKVWTNTKPISPAVVLSSSSDSSNATEKTLVSSELSKASKPKVTSTEKSEDEPTENGGTTK